MLSLEQAVLRRVWPTGGGTWQQPCMWCELNFPVINNRRYCSQNCKKSALKHKSKIHACQKEEELAQKAENEEKVCTCCKKTKPVSDFYKIGVYKKTKKPRYRSHCKSCCSLKAASKWSDNPEFRETRKNVSYKHNLQKNYGITEATYMEMYLKQKGVCAICEKRSELKSGRLAVDHCHETSKVRGLLCRKCNSGLGLLGDNIQLLSRAIEYLVEN